LLHLQKKFYYKKFATLIFEFKQIKKFVNIFFQKMKNFFRRSLSLNLSRAHSAFLFTPILRSRFFYQTSIEDVGADGSSDDTPVKERR